MSELPTLPVRLRVHLAHATVQAVADVAGADILHIKGPAVNPSLRPDGRASDDADVLVRPAHLDLLLTALDRHGWRRVTALRDGGLVLHSTNWYHPQLGQLDVHIRFPGIQAAPDQAFDLLWRDHATQFVARRPCVVPSLDGQRLILLLHAARSLTSYGADVAAAWHNASDSDRERVTSLARELRAEVALAAATGTLEQYRDRPEYDLWRLYAEGRTTTTGFTRLIAEIKAAPAGFRWVPIRVIGYAVGLLWHVPHRLATTSGRAPGHIEIAHGYAALLRRGADLFARKRTGSAGGPRDEPSRPS